MKNTPIRVKAKGALESARQKPAGPDWLQGILDAFPVPALALDQFHRIQCTNGPFAALLDSTADALFGRDIRNIGGGALNVPDLDNVLRFIEAGPAAAGDFSVKLPWLASGHQASSWHVLRIPSKGSSTRALVIIEGADQRRAASEAPPKAAAQSKRMDFRTSL